MCPWENASEQEAELEQKPLALGIIQLTLLNQRCCLIIEARHNRGGVETLCGVSWLGCGAQRASPACMLRAWELMPSLSRGAGVQSPAPQHRAGMALTSGRFWGSLGVSEEPGLPAPCCCRAVLQCASGPGGCRGAERNVKS